MSIVYLNGSFLPREDACVSVLDRGFLFGDGVYEVIPVYSGRLFRIDHHLQRLQNSLDGIRIRNPLGMDDWRDLLEELLRKNAPESRQVSQDQAIYLQVTRGTADTRDHRFPAKVHPTVYASLSVVPPRDPEVMQNGIAAITLDDIRWQFCHIKAITLLPNVLLRQQAEDREVSEAILVRDGHVLEGSASNVFVIRNGVIATPPNGPEILPGVTRDLVIELAKEHRMACETRPIDVDELYEADEIWVTSSTREIHAVTRLDDQPVGEGRPGPVWHTMVDLYERYKDAVRAGKTH